jgi:hypothetical protein
MRDSWFFSLSDAASTYTKQVGNSTGNSEIGSAFCYGKMSSASWDKPAFRRSVSIRWNFRFLLKMLGLIVADGKWKKVETIGHPDARPPSAFDIAPIQSLVS